MEVSFFFLPHSPSQLPPTVLLEVLQHHHYPCIRVADRDQIPATISPFPGFLPPFPNSKKNFFLIISPPRAGIDLPTYGWREFAPFVFPPARFPAFASSTRSRFLRAHPNRLFTTVFGRPHALYNRFVQHIHFCQTGKSSQCLNAKAMCLSGKDSKALGDCGVWRSCLQPQHRCF